METKKCFKCNKELVIESFYIHDKLKGGRMNKCKSCTKKDVRRRYYDPLSREKIIAYEKARAQNPERKNKASEYQKKSRMNHPGKHKARAKISNSIRDGKLLKEPCCVCGDTKVEAHHTDYRSPLKVVWLCRRHHLEAEGKQTYLK